MINGQVYRNVDDEGNMLHIPAALLRELMRAVKEIPQVRRNIMFPNLFGCILG